MRREGHPDEDRPGLILLNQTQNRLDQTQNRLNGTATLRGCAWLACRRAKDLATVATLWEEGGFWREAVVRRRANAFDRYGLAYRRRGSALKYDFAANYRYVGLDVLDLILSLIHI